jgi:hypothetical protein
MPAAVPIYFHMIHEMTGTTSAALKQAGSDLIALPLVRGHKYSTDQHLIRQMGSGR